MAPGCAEFLGWSPSFRQIDKIIGAILLEFAVRADVKLLDLRALSLTRSFLLVLPDKDVWAQLGRIFRVLKQLLEYLDLLQVLWQVLQYTMRLDAPRT